MALSNDFQQLAQLRQLGALTEFHISFEPLGNGVIHCVGFLRHFETPFREVRPIEFLSLTMVGFYAGGDPSPRGGTSYQETPHHMMWFYPVADFRSLLIIVFRIPGRQNR